MTLKRLLGRFRPIKYYLTGKRLSFNKDYIEVQKLIHAESIKRPSRTEVINYLLSLFNEETRYLEIGVRFPEDNFDLITADIKHGVDPGLENKANPVEFKMTSDAFFDKLSTNQILSKSTRYHVVFIDGLHLAPQVDRDISNALRFLKEDGFVVLHDCNPPSEWMARETMQIHLSPARDVWTGTTWKAFLKWRFNPDVYSCCIDSDWGIGILSKHHEIGNCINPVNPFFEFRELALNRKEYLNLVDFETFRNCFKERK